MITKTQDNAKQNNEFYDQYLALDWPDLKMAVARIGKRGQKDHVRENPTDLGSLKKYLSNLQGSKLLTIEETTSTHWLYVELKDYVNKILVCDPYRNGLLKDGPKSDMIDARKLCRLLRGNILKEVFHSTDEAYEIRKLMSTYDDIVKTITRTKNQRAALYRSIGKKFKRDTIANDATIESFINDSYNRTVNQLEEIKQIFISKFNEIIKTNQMLKNLMSINGIGPIWAMTIYSTVVDASRFANKYKFWSYCGLTYNMKESGGRIYGRKRPRFSRQLKKVFCFAAYSAIGGNGDEIHIR